MSTVAEQLRAARALIADPAHWCRFFGAEDANGNPVSPTDTTAVRWCASGAFARAAGFSETRLACDYLDHRIPPRLAAEAAAVGPFSTPCVTHINDSLGHSAVLAFFDAASAAAEAEVRP